jgi:hypothetical protein
LKKIQTSKRFKAKYTVIKIIKTKIDKITNQKIQLFFWKFKRNYLGNRERKKKKTFTAAQPNILCKHTSNRQKKNDTLLLTPQQKQDFGCCSCSILLSIKYYCQWILVKLEFCVCGNTFVVGRVIITVVIGEFSVEELDHVI